MKPYTSVAVALGLAASACGYTGQARALTPEAWKAEQGWISADHVNVRHQRAEYDCGPTALQMVFDHFCPDKAPMTAAGFGENRRVSAGELRDRARQLGFAAYVVAGTFQDIEHELSQNRPVIVGVAKPVGKKKAVAHYEVVVGIAPKQNRIALIDPQDGLRQNSFAGFLEEWIPAKRLMIVLMPTRQMNVCSAASGRQAAPLRRPGTTGSGSRASTTRSRAAATSARYDAAHRR